MDRTGEQDLRVAIAERDRAMVANDPDRIGRYLADDWRIIGPDGSVSDRYTFLDLIRTGVLTHDVMTSEALDIRLHGEAATTIARGTSGGVMHGHRFLVVERVTCTYVREDGRWRCVLTHLSRLDGPGENGN